MRRDLNSWQLVQLRVLLSKLGGVAGAIHRIVRRFNGVFTSSDVRLRLAVKYPLLDPAPYQVQDSLEGLILRGVIRSLGCNGWEILYRRRLA